LFIISILILFTPQPVKANQIPINGFSNESIIIIKSEIDILEDKLLQLCNFSGCEYVNKDNIMNIVFGDIEINLINNGKKFSSCWSSMNCYGNLDYSIPKYRGLIIHELGHRFMTEDIYPANQLSFSLGYYEKDVYIHVSGYLPNIPEKKYLRTSLGYIQPGQPYEQHSPDWGIDGQGYDEDYADMFMGWVMGYFSDDEAGKLRQGYMDKYVKMVLKDKIHVETEFCKNNFLFKIK